MNNQQWEINYKNGKEVNKYPFDILISFFNNYKYLLKKDINNPFRICELGCGCGNNLVFFAENNCEVYGIDISPTAIKYANELFEKKKLKGFFYTCNLIDHPFEKEYFDLVIDRGCFVHNPKYLDKCIDITYNILKKEGLFFSMLFQKNHSGLKLANKIINNEYYFTDDENYFWYNLQLIILNDNEIKDYYQKFKILEWNLYNIENKINKYIIEYVYLYCQKLK